MWSGKKNTLGYEFISLKNFDKESDSNVKILQPAGPLPASIISPDRWGYKPQGPSRQGPSRRI